MDFFFFFFEMNWKHQYFSLGTDFHVKNHKTVRYTFSLIKLTKSTWNSTNSHCRRQHKYSKGQFGDIFQKH